MRFNRLLLVYFIFSVPTVTTRAEIHRSVNFKVDAEDGAVARQIAEIAEKLRKQFALDWLKEELPPWVEQCDIRVIISLNSSTGSTSFIFDKGKVLSQSMRIEGALDRILSSTLPHEMTHVILAHGLGKPVPRWADEGAAVLAEDEAEQKRHQMLVKEMVNAKRTISLSRLLALKEYPPDVMVLYAQGHSIARMLIEQKDRPTFLAFLRQATEDRPEVALKKYYGYDDFAALEASWLQQLRMKTNSP